MGKVQICEGPSKTFRADAAYAQYIWVQPTANENEVTVAADGGVKAIGYLESETFAVNEAVSVALLGKRTFWGVAAGAISRAAHVEVDAGGDWNAAAGATKFVALTAATAAGQYIEIAECIG